MVCAKEVPAPRLLGPAVAFGGLADVAEGVGAGSVVLLTSTSTFTVCSASG